LDTTGTITNFTSTPNTVFGIGDDRYRVETAGQSYSLTNPDAQTLRFEIRPGDRWFANDGSSVDRADIDGSANRDAVIPAGTPINLNYQFMVEPNGPNGSFTNTASWFVTGQMHSADWVTGVGTSPPFAIQLAGNHLQVVARYVQPGGNPSNLVQRSSYDDAVDRPQSHYNWPVLQHQHPVQCIHTPAAGIWTSQSTATRL